MSAVYKLLTQACSLPCAQGATTILSLVPSEDNWFSFALESLLPTLQDRNLQVPERILAAYILHSLYDTHPSLNPFRNHLASVFQSERSAAIAHSQPLGLQGASSTLSNSSSDTQIGTEQLVWVLWKILRGEGEDLASYSPDILAHKTLPVHLHPLHLEIKPDTNLGGLYLPFETAAPFALQSHMVTTNDKSFEQGPPPPAHTHPHIFAPQTFAPTPVAQLASTVSFSPFDNKTSPNLHSARYENISGRMAGKWAEKRPQNSHNGIFSAVSDITFPHPTLNHPGPIQKNSFYIDSITPVAADDHQRSLLRALYQEPAFPESEDPLYVSRNHTSNMEGRETGFHSHSIDDGGIGPSRGLQETQTQRSQQLPSHSILPGLQTWSRTLSPHGPRELGHPSGLQLTTSPLPSFTTVPRLERPQPGPIASPRSASSSSSIPTSQAYSLTTAEITVANKQKQSVEHEPQKASSPIHNGFLHDLQRPMSNGDSLPTHAATRIGPLQQLPDASQPLRTPGIIGSGRPPKSTARMTDEGFLNRNLGADGLRPRVGVIGNGRPGRNMSPARPEPHVTGQNRAMMPHSVPTEGNRESGVRKDFGAIQRPKHNGKDVRERNTLSGPGGNHAQVEDIVLADAFAQISLMPKADETVTNPSQTSSTMSTCIPVATLHTQISPDGQATYGLTVPSEVQSTLSSSASPLELSVKSENQESSLSPQEVPVPTSTFQTNSPEDAHPVQRSPITHSTPAYEEKEREELEQAILLLLSARERVLTLSEQRMLILHLPMLTHPLSLLRPNDLPPLVAKNPDVAAKLLIHILDRDDEETGRVECVLQGVSKSDLLQLGSILGSEGTQIPPSDGTVNSVDATGIIQSTLEFVNNYGRISPKSSGPNKAVFLGGREAKEEYLDALRKLPPTMQSFNLIAKLLRPTPATFPVTEGAETAEMRVAKLIHAEVLGGLVSGCMQWIEKAEQQQKDGEMHDDRVAVSVSSLSRFYSSLLKHGFVSATSEVDTTEIMSFALQFSRFEEARSLYSTLAAARA